MRKESGHGPEGSTQETGDEVAAFEEEDGPGEDQDQGDQAETALAMQEEASYVCDSCGEEIVIPIDFSAGESQEYVEDCPVCCRPNVVHVEMDGEGGLRVWAERE